MQKIAIVTGANKGIGRAIVQKLIQEAPQFKNIILTSRTPSLGLATLQQIENSFHTYGRIKYHQLDILDDSSISNFHSFIQQTYGKFDVLINNAGVAVKGSEFNRKIAQWTLQTNYYGLKKTTDTLLPSAAEKGHIINVTSIQGKVRNIPSESIQKRLLDPFLTREQLQELVGQFLQSVQDGTWQQKGWCGNTYQASKNMANAYTRILAREVKEEGIPVRVNAIHPGWIKTDMAGPEAPNQVEVGARGPVKLAKMEEFVSGTFWNQTNQFEWF